MEFVFEGLNQALVGLSQELLSNGVKRNTPGLQKGITESSYCLEFPEPVTVRIKKPQARHVLLRERKWNNMLPYAEALWIALGWNNLDDLPGKYVKSLYKFSDDGKGWRAGYGPRIRSFDSDASDYDVGENISGMEGAVDQLKFVIETLKKDPNSRQALITIHDPIKDDFDYEGNLKVTKDQPCTRSLHFMKDAKTGALKMNTTMRSNDLLWGFSAVNVFNFTWMQEYVADILGWEVGSYFHIAHNLHVYSNMLGTLEKIASCDISEAFYMDYYQAEYWRQFKVSQVTKEVTDWKDFDPMIRSTLLHERASWKGDASKFENIFNYPALFQVWMLRFYLKNIPETQYNLSKEPLLIQWLEFVNLI